MFTQPTSPLQRSRSVRFRFDDAKDEACRWISDEVAFCLGGQRRDLFLLANGVEVGGNKIRPTGTNGDILKGKKIRR